MTDEELAQASQLILTVLRFCSPAQREQLFNEWKHHYCPDCGDTQGPRWCQCTNDE